jgi:hypothetical protein
METDLKLFRKEPIRIILDEKRTVEIEEFTASKAIKIIDRYKNIYTSVSAEFVKKDGESGAILKDDKYMLRLQDKVIDLCVDAIKPKLNIHSLLNGKYFKYFYLSTGWIKNNLNLLQIDEFLKVVLAPILGDENKKKIDNLEKILNQ